MNRTEEERYREFVVARVEALRRTAYLLCRDWHGADDLVAITLGKLYRGWSRACAADSMDAYVRGILTNAYLDELRRPWRREALADRLPEQDPTPGPDIVLAQREELIELLARLAPGQRAVVVLRFYCDLSITETAQLLSLSEGAVKSQAARGLAALRALSLAGRAES